MGTVQTLFVLFPSVRICQFARIMYTAQTHSANSHAILLSLASRAARIAWLACIFCVTVTRL